MCSRMNCSMRRTLPSILMVLVSLSFGSLETVSAQDTTWTLQTIPFTNGYLSDICFVDENRGWAVGFNQDTEQAAIVHTTDGGEVWELQQNPQNGVLSGVHFLDANTGYAVGQDWDWGRIAIRKTTNGGGQWHTPNIPVIQGSLEDVIFVSASDGWVVGAEWTVDGFQTLILRTGDGTSWERSDHPEHIGWLLAVYFHDSEHGWAVGFDEPSAAPIILNTNDGGESWVEQTHPVSNGMFVDVFFISEHTGWTAGISETSAVVLKTNDGGLTWSAVGIFEGSFKYVIESNLRKRERSVLSGGSNKATSIYFMNPIVGYVAYNTMSESYTTASLHTTADGGSTFTEAVKPLDNAWIQNITKADNKIYGAGNLDLSPLVTMVDMTYEPYLDIIEIDPASVNLAVGDTVELTATGKDQYGSDYQISNPVWETSNGGNLDPNGTKCTFAATEVGCFTISCHEFGTDIIGIAYVYVDSCDKPGDVNMDGNVDILDALSTVNYILGEHLQNFNPACADCNKDGQTNIIDVLGIVNVILGIGVCVP